MTPKTSILPNEALPGAQFGDRFSVVVPGQGLDALAAAKGAFDRPPPWIRRLMALRNIIVRPFGLITDPTARRASEAHVGVFPLIRRTRDGVLLGFDDRHLDFRVLVEVRELGEAGQEVSAMTLVETHNLLGRVYLALVKPFHRLIVPAMLAQLQASSR